MKKHSIVSTLVLLLLGCNPVQYFTSIDMSPMYVGDKNLKNYHLLPLEKKQIFDIGREYRLPIVGNRNGNWPHIDRVNWQYENDFTQIAQARTMVIRKIKNGYKPIRVAVLDVGYNTDTGIKPSLFKIGPDFFGKDYDSGISGNGYHGVDTTNILAGGMVKVYERGRQNVVYHDFLGAAPMVEIISVRVAPEVAMFRQSPFAYHRLKPVLEWAKQNKVDVISMSMGGAYSISLSEAVKDARESGIAMFFAAGNYLTLPFVSMFRTPDIVVFPAAFGGAFGVAGATATNRTYGYPPDYFSFVKHGIGGWLQRGNWGPMYQMKKNIISAYTPNIFALSAEAKHMPILNPDFGGTSAATPQVAGAAALWLQYYRDSFTEKEWRSATKVDAVYRALADSAKQLPSAPKSKYYTTKHFGYGIIQASDALRISPAEAKKRNLIKPIYKANKLAEFPSFFLRNFTVISTERIFFTEKDLTPYTIKKINH